MAMHGVSQWVKEAVSQIIQREGNPKEADTLKESTALGFLLASANKQEDKDFIQGFMIEHIESKNSKSPQDEPQPRSERFYRDDGSYYDEVYPTNPPGKGWIYIAYNSDGTKTVTETKIVDGVEVPDTKIFYDNEGQEYQRYEYYGENDKYQVPVSDDNIPKEVPSKSAETEMQDKQTNITPDDGKMSAEEIKEARDIGGEVAKRLIGLTGKNSEEIVKLNLEKITPENVLEFLRGYEEACGVQMNNTDLLSYGIFSMFMAMPSSLQERGDAFFKQMRTKWNPEKQDLMRNIATALKDFVADRYGQDSPLVKEFEVILLEDKFTRKETAKLDSFVTKLLTENLN